MKLVKILLIFLLIYVGVVVLFESSLGYFQPQNEGTLVLAVADDEGVVNQRVLTRIEVEGQLYVAVNHWPRQWYYRALENPAVTVTSGGVTYDATAVAVTSDEEAARVTQTSPAGLVFRVLTGFPPRYFVRLDQKMTEPVSVSSWPLELEDASDIADIKLLDEAVLKLSSSIMACVNEGTVPSEQCQCQHPEVVAEAKAVFDRTIAKHPDWQDQSILWWKDDSKSYSYNLNMSGLEAQFAKKCD